MTMEYKEMQNNFEDIDPFIMMEEVLNYDHPNPFFVSSDGSKLKYAKTKILSSDYKFVYILCLEDNFEPNASNKKKIQLFHDPESNILELKGQAKLVTLIRGPFSLLQLSSIRSGLIEIGNDFLEYFNHECYELNNKELVYLMLETRERNIKSWFSLYETDTNLDTFIEQKIFSSYYDLTDKKLEDNMIELIGKVGDSSYWQDDHNCLLSMDSIFAIRKFNLSFIQKWNLDVEEIDKELKNMLQNFKATKTVMVTNYPNQILDPNIKDTSQKKKPEEDILKMNIRIDDPKLVFKSYFSLINTDELIIKKENVEELLIKNSLNEKEKYFLICNLLVSKNYCHYVVNNKNVINANADLFEKYKPVFRYLLGYAWISLYKEEIIKKKNMQQSDRFVFDIDVASTLPVFPFSISSPYLNPYFCFLVSDKTSNYDQNIGGVQQYAECQNGIVDLAEFRRRLNIFISGTPNKDIFEGINWSNMVITGGIMAAIIPKTNPLMLLFKKIPDSQIPISDQELDRFFQEYYANSDIDIACNHQNILDFIQHVKHVRDIVCKNLGPNTRDSDVQINPIKTLAVNINTKILKEKCDKKEIPFDYDYIIDNKNKRAVKFYFYELYLEMKKMSNQKNRLILGERINDDEYFEIIDYCEFDKIVLIINDFAFEGETIENRSPEFNSGIEMVYFLKDDCQVPHSNNDNMNNNERKEQSNIFIKFSETLKYKITSKYIKHCIEIFRINSTEFFSCIYRFHLPCVRSYYNGSNCYMLPSAITSYQTLTNIDFKYFIGSHDPISIINKYRNRGYGTLLNQIEINQFLAYIMITDPIKRTYGIAAKSDIKNAVGCIDVNNNFFKPRKNLPNDFNFDSNIKLDYMSPKLNHLKTKDDIIKLYKKKYATYSSEFIEKRTIAPSGHIDPLKRWMIDASYDFLK